MAAIETTPVTSRDDAADDPVIWVHPQNPEASLVIGTDKQFGIEVYNLAGERVQSVAAGRTNNVDLRMLADGGTWSAIAAASNRTTNTISLFAIDLEGRLTWLRDSEVETGLTEPYGLCMFSNEFGLQVFVNDTDGRYQQWLLIPRADSTDLAGIDSRLLREFTVPSQPEGCVADDANQRLFIGVEDEGIRLIQANHLEPARLQSLANIDGNRLVADVEGMSLYLDGARGYLVVSSQGNYSYAVFDRLPPYHYRGSFVVVDSETTAVDGTEETDGLDISSLLRTSAFPDGMLVVQDGYNRRPRSSQNFKFISWQQVRSALSLD
ncbi:MAG: phytase [Gammaproteobacteria bacterium]|nr:phytase [Pseudomonadales bacterium]MCP5348977.1 phytase [Pseudomonadales bacterium]